MIYFSLLVNTAIFFINIFYFYPFSYKVKVDFSMNPHCLIASVFLRENSKLN